MNADQYQVTDDDQWGRIRAKKEQSE